MSKPINRSKTTQISDPCDFDVNNLIFDEPIKTDARDGVPAFYRINLATRIGKTESELIFELDRCKMFGIKESVDKQSNKLTGYAVGIMMYDQIPTERQTQTLQTLLSVVEKCKDHLMDADIKKKIGKHAGSTAIKVREQLDVITPISFMKDKETQEIDNNQPVINAKLIYSKPKKDKEGNDVEGRIITRFYSEDEVDENGEPQELNIMDYLNKSGFIRAAVRFESIFVGKDIKIQVKIYEAEVKFPEKSGFKRLLRFNGSSKTTTNIDLGELSQTEPIFESQTKVVNDELKVSDNEEEEVTTKKKKKVVKKEI